MRLFVSPMDCTLTGVEPDGRVRLDDEDFRLPTLQERRAIIYAAREEIDALTELVEILEREPAQG
jgi:hypothetical protein